MSAPKKTKNDTSRTAETVDLKLGRRAATVKAWIETRPGVMPELFSARKGSVPFAIIYKIMGKMFAILSVRPIENVILKCDPYLATMLREQYEGVGHRSHLDRRYWISVNLDADVPTKEVKRLVSQSYDLVCANLTTKQRAALERVGGKEAAPGVTDSARSGLLSRSR